MRAGPFGLSDEGYERVGLDLSRVGQGLQPGRVRRRGRGTDEKFDTLSLHPITSLQIWRPLDAEAGHPFELCGEIEQLVLLRKAYHELDSHRQAIVQAPRNRDRRNTRKCHRQDELDVSSPLLTQKRRHALD